MPLSETHFSLFRAAAERADLLLTCPEGLSTRAATALATKLIRADLVVEVTVTADQPSWSNIGGGATGLRITSAGMAEIGFEAEEPTPSLPESDDQVADCIAEPRSGSKLALVLSLLRREQGATLQDLIGATGWLPHSTRAALTGLRKRGYRLKRTRTAEGQSTYWLRIEPAAAAATDTTAV